MHEAAIKGLKRRSYSFCDIITLVTKANIELGASERVAVVIASTKSTTEFMLMLVNDLLDLGAGKVSSAKEKVDASAL